MHNMHYLALALLTNLILGCCPHFATSGSVPMILPGMFQFYLLV